MIELATDLVRASRDQLLARRRQIDDLIAPLRAEGDRIDAAVAALNAIIDGDVPAVATDATDAPVATEPPAPAKADAKPKAKRKLNGNLSPRKPSKYNRDAIEAKGRELGVFTTKLLGEQFGAATGSMAPIVRDLRDAGKFVRQGGHGPTGYYTHVSYTGPHNVALAKTGARQASAPAPESATLERARDFVVRQRSPFTSMAMAMALGIDKPVADGFCDRFVMKGMLRVAGGTVDAPLFEYVKPTDPGPAAKTNGRHVDVDLTPRRGAPVAGTGRGQRMPTKEGRDLQDRIEKAGGRVEFGGSHPVAVVGDKRITLSGTPSDSRSRDNEIARLRREGLEI